MKLNLNAIIAIAKDKKVEIEAGATALEALNVLTNAKGVVLSKSELAQIGLSSGDSWDSVMTVDNFTPASFEVGERQGKTGTFSVFKAIDSDGKTLSLKESQYFQMLEIGRTKQFFHLVEINEGRYENKETKEETPFISFKFNISTSATSSQELKYNKESSAFTSAEVQTIKGQKSFSSGLEYLKRKSINVPELVALGLMEEVAQASEKPLTAAQKKALAKAGK